jgi:hypothetical protein
VSGENGWSDYQKLIIYRLDMLDRRAGELADEVAKARTEIASLKVRSGMWGAVSGLITAALAAAAAAFSHRNS